MRNDPDTLGRLRAFSCACPLGMWPLCGIGVVCGYWERHARVGCITIETIDGLTRPFVLTLAGSAPAILLPAWAVGAVREYVISWALCEVARIALGEEAINARIAQAVDHLEAS